MNWWEVVIQPAVAFIAFIGLIIMNVLVWVFAWGRSVGKVNTRLKVVEEKVDNPQILHACSEIFTEIKEKLAKLDGKVGTILIVMKERQKNDEKKRVRRKSKSTE